MRNQKINDERVLAQKRKIQSDAFSVLFFGLLLSVLVQQFIFHAPISQYLVELIFFLSSSIYLLVRDILNGNDIFSNQSSKKIIIINSFVCGLTITIIHTALNYLKLGSLFTTDFSNTLLISLTTFLCTTTIAYIGFKLLYTVNMKRKQQLETKFNDEDE
jgi:uncharacterized membrane protein